MKLIWNSFKSKLKNNLFPILSGIEIGIPINFMSKMSTDVNFITSPLTKESVILNFLLGFSTYKADRYLDAIEYFNSNFNCTFDGTFNSTLNCNFNECNVLNLNENAPKFNYYQSLLNNEKSIEFTIFSCYIALLVLIVNYNIGIILPLIISTFGYKELKENKQIGFLKPFYVAGMWTFSCCMIPILMHNTQMKSTLEFNNLNLHDYYQLLSPTFLSLFSTTNLADLKDIDEDIINGVNTLPIVLGIQNTKNIILVSSILSVLIFVQSEYFSWSFQNLFFISSGILPNLQLFNFSNN